MKPKFTDLDRYRTGYVPSGKTNVRKTFARARAAEEAKRQQAEGEELRIRAEEAAIEAEVKTKVRPMKRAGRP